MSYVLLKSMAIKRKDGVMEKRNAGDLCPEAASWPNPAVWVNSGHIRALNDQVVVPGYDRSKIMPARSAEKADVVRGQNSVSLEKGKVTPREPQEKRDSLDELLVLSRPDLDALAEEHGVKDSFRLPNKAAVAVAILA